ncbi:MAG: citrate (Si)-synthase [Candidatus Shapirobacteria bacterium]
MIIHDEIARQLPDTRRRVLELMNKSGDCHIANITINHLLGGIKNIDLLVSDISYADVEKGLCLRGYSIPEVLNRLPKPKGINMPYIGGLYYLLMTGNFPTKSQAQVIEKDWSLRASQIPDYIFKMLSIMPRDTHPMTLLSQAVLALQNTSSFERTYRLEINKKSSWESALDDSLDLTAKLPVIAAYIYQLKYSNNVEIPQYNSQLDYAHNLARMMNVSDEEAYANLTRFYFTLHSDHGSGNVSAHTMHLVGSVLSSPFYAFSASLNALAGPLHGLASQESLNWLLKILKNFGGIPTASELSKYVSQEINSGKIIPGYSHALLKVIDPRFVMLLNYANDHFPQDELVRLSNLIFTIITSELASKTSNPNPNLDAVSGVLQYHYGVTQSDFYPVIFGLSRSLGLTANYVWSRALNFPIERPNSLTIQMLEDIAKKNNF